MTHLDHVELFWQKRGEAGRHHESYDLGALHALRKEMSDFVAWVQEEKDPCLTWREGLRCVEVMETAHHSANQNGDWISLPLYPELEMAI